MAVCLRWSPSARSCGLFLLFATALATTPSSLRAQQRPVIELVGQTGGFVTIMALDGDRAYVATGPGLTVLDVSDPAAPRLVGASDVLPIHGAFAHLAATGGLVFATVSGNAMQVFDVPRTGRPVRLGEIPGYSKAPIVAADGHLFVSSGPTLFALDVADPLKPRVMSTTPLYASSFMLYLYEDQLFVVAGQGRGMLVLDVQDPAEPQVVKWFENIDARGVAVSDGLAFVTTAEERESPSTPGAEMTVQSVRVLDPSVDFAELGRIEYDEERHWNMPPSDAVLAAGRRVYLCIQKDVVVIDARDPSDPREIARFAVPPNANMTGSDNAVQPERYALSGNRLYLTFNEYVADRAHSFEPGVAVFALDDPAHVADIGAWTQAVPGNVTEVVVTGDTLLVGEMPSNRVRLYDVASWTDPRQVAMIEVDTMVRDFASDGDRLVIADGPHRIHVIDISEPSLLRQLAYRDLRQVMEVQVRGDYVYAAHIGPGETGERVGHLAILKVTANNGLEDVYDLEGVPTYASELALFGDVLVWVGDTAGVTFIAVGNPAHPIVVGNIDTPYRARGLALAGDTAYIACKLPTPADQRDQPVWPTYGGIMIVDASDPASPRQVSISGGHLDDYRSNARWGIGATNGYALLAAAEGYVRAIDVHDSSSPVEVQKPRVPGVVGALATTGDYAYVAGQDAGLLVLRVNGDTGIPEASGIFLPSILRRH